VSKRNWEKESQVSPLIYVMAVQHWSKDSKQAIPEIIKLGDIEKNKRAAVIQKELEVKQVSQEYLHRVD
jgi:hypothetical protein